MPSTSINKDKFILSHIFSSSIGGCKHNNVDNTLSNQLSSESNLELYTNFEFCEEYIYIYHRHQAKQFVTIQISKDNIQILEDGASGVQGDIE